jgi:hypothetical protein
MFDNRLFSVNGETCPMLESALKLAFDQEGTKTAWGWKVNHDYGIILCTYSTSGFTPFLTPMSSDTTTSTIWDWLCDQDVDDFKLDEWEEDCDHDGTNDKGWRVYTDTWGDVDEGFIAIKPVYLWYGK